MSNETNLLSQFDKLCARIDDFTITAGLIVKSIAIEKGEEHVMNRYKWYSQISHEIIQGDVSTITDIEKVEFVKLHIELTKALNTNTKEQINNIIKAKI
jgi:hypothetical protein